MQNNYSLLNTFHLSLKKVKILLIQQDKQVTQVAEDLKLPQPLISKYIHGRGRNPKIQQAIADYLGVPLDDIIDKDERSHTDNAA